MRWSSLISLSLLPVLLHSRPLQDDDMELNLAPGPPEIISDDDYDSGFDFSSPSLYEDSLNETEFLESLAPIEPTVKLNLTAFVSRKPHVDEPAEKDGGYDDIIQDLLDLKMKPTSGDSDLGLQLTWWQILILSVGGLLVTCLCCYFTSCCYLTLDCCSDPYWGCCLCCHACVQPTKPPPHVHIVTRKPDTITHSKYSLNENSTAPRTRGSSKSLTFSKGSNKSVNVVNGAPAGEDSSHFNSKERKYSRSSRKVSGEGEEERLLSGSGTYPRVQASANTLTSCPESQTATLSSVKSVRNYKRTTRPASTLNGDFAKNAGLSETLPLVYQDGTGSYFSWLHLFGRSKRRYNVSRRKKKPGTNNGVHNNNHIYRQTRYRHIAESRNSAVIPTKISKRTSTASTYNTRPHMYMRSRSAETVDSQADTMAPMMETVVSERHIPRSRLSANLAQLENKTVPEYNLQYFERSLMKSKETTL